MTTFACSLVLSKDYSLMCEGRNSS